VLVVLGPIMLKEDEHEDAKIQDEHLVSGPVVCVAGPLRVVEFQLFWNRLMPIDEGSHDIG
jgi:hypothetical protein